MQKQCLVKIGSSYCAALYGKEDIHSCDQIIAVQSWKVILVIIVAKNYAVVAAEWML